MKILITGSRGFVGGSVGRFAAHKGHDVLGISRAAQPATDWPGAYVSADVVSADLSQSIRNFAPDAVFHAAGTASVGASFSAPLADLRASLLSWANVLDSVRRSTLQPVLLFPSSAAVYGQPEQSPVTENAAVRPISPYGFHKAACELLAREYADCFGQRVIVCRAFSLVGAAQRRLLIWELFQQFIGGEQTVWLQGTGAETRDYLSADSLAAAALDLMETQTGIMQPGACRIVNVGSGTETRVLDVAKQIGKLVAPEKDIRCLGLKRAGDPESWQADISSLRSLVPQWKPEPFDQALSACIVLWQKSS
ncbi:MAG: NAD-dependent epimerase/dehydratase family protein [Pyrinomonadaceae bacterium]